MIKPYRYTMDGTASAGQTWTTTGELFCDFADVFDHAMRATFDQLTEGKAVYGQPGKGCAGPYDVRRLIIEAA